MNKTDWIFSEANHNLHQEFSDQERSGNPIDNTNPAELRIDFPTSFNVTDLSPKNNTMTLMRFPINWRQWRSQHEETLQRRANHQGNQAA